MRDYGSVPTSFWSDPEIQKLSDQGKLLALYLLTGLHTNMVGCFRLPIGYVAEDLQWSFETVSKGFRELLKIGFAIRDEVTGWVLIPQFLGWNPVENPNQGKSIRRLFEQVPQKSAIFQALIQILLLHSKYFDEPFRNRLETLAKPFRNQDQDQEQDQNQDQEQDQNQDQEQKQDQKQGQDQDQDEVGAPPRNGGLPIAKMASGSPPAAQTQVSKMTGDILAILLNDGSSYGISPQQIERWQSLYPAIDVVQELRNICAWNEANPKRRKTKSGVLHHVNQWLAKEQNRARHPRVLKPPDASTLHARNRAIAEQWLEASAEKPLKSE